MEQAIPRSLQTAVAFLLLLFLHLHSLGSPRASLGSPVPWGGQQQSILPPSLALPEPAGAGAMAASHHGGPGDGVLRVRLVPGSEAVDVAAGGQGGPFARHGDVPERGDVGGAGGEGGGGVEVLPVGRAGALLHDLLVLGALVLEPDLHLREGAHGECGGWGLWPMFSLLDPQHQ